MNPSERIARLLAGMAVLAAIAIPLVLWWRTPLVHAQMAEDGGWSPDSFVATVGVPLRLRLTSDDVMHGFAVGKLDFPAVDVPPGKVTDIALLLSEPGTYTFYCTRWCGLNHWRMRGTIEVAEEEPTAPHSAAPGQPLYASLGIDLDAPRGATIVPVEKPRVGTAPQPFQAQLARYLTVGYYVSHSPYEVWQELRNDPAFTALDDAALWRMTAWIWKSNTSREGLEDGARLFSQNCAACHGAGGAGDGVFAEDLALAGEASVESRPDGAMGMKRPVDFTEPAQLLSASPALLQGKILRGGMGTGMPSWGPIFTDGQSWNLVAYLYSFQFEYR